MHVKDGTGGNAGRRHRRRSRASGDVARQASLELIPESLPIKNGSGDHDHDWNDDRPHRHLPTRFDTLRKTLMAGKLKFGPLDRNVAP